MASLKLIEYTVKMVMAEVESNISAALAQVSSDRADHFVSLESPLSYFYFWNAQAYQAPAVFVIAEDFDMRLLDTGPNFVNALARVNVAVTVEDKDEYYVTIKAWRYQAALTKILHLAHMLSADQQVKLVAKVVRTTFSSLYPKDKSDQDPDEVFRKEVVVELEVEHYENIQT